jgi:hypothetical protein
MQCVLMTFFNDRVSTAENGESVKINTMLFSTIKRRLTSWIAIFVIFGGALAPSISMAIAKNYSGQFVMEICSSSELGKVMPIDLGQDRSSGQAETKNEHCAFCLTISPYVPATQSNLKFEKPEGSPFFPTLFYQSHKPLHAWLTQPSRAPPLNI